MKHSRFIIGAATSGAGKTTLTTGLLRALQQKGLSVAPFKCGPDYIDTKFHAAAAQRPSFNLDLYLSSEQHVREIVASQSLGRNVAVIEGVMGLFDGYNGKLGSSAEVAVATSSPVVLVVNAKATAYSVAPLIHGFASFDPRVKVAGVVFNNVASAAHGIMLDEAANDVGIKVLGHLPTSKNIELKSRHLGLSILNNDELEQKIEEIASVITRHIDIDLLLESTKVEALDLPAPSSAKQGALKIAVARDEAFNFTYEQNIRALQSYGDVRFFSPLHDSALPPSCDFVYLAGGYPEFYLQQLSDNKSMLRSIADYHKNDGSMLGECGGMMFLGKEIIDKEGNCFPMAGVFEQSVTMQDMKLNLGYRTVSINNNVLKGHEFHYSRVVNSHSPCIPATVTNSKNEEVNTYLYKDKQSTGSYIHFYWGERMCLDVLFPHLFNKIDETR